MKEAIIPAVRYGSLRNWPRLRKLIRFRDFKHTKRGWMLRTSWLEASGGWGIGAEFIQWDSDGDNDAPSLMLAPLYGRFYFKLPRRLARPLHSDADMMESWGFSWHWGRDGAEYIHTHWGRHTKLLRVPALDFGPCLHEVRWADGSWVSAADSEYSPPYSDGRHVEVHPYRYLMQDGTIQHRTATIYASRRSWKRRWVPGWMPGSRKVRTSINVTFSDEVGERSGSWKGGCIGCGYDLRPGETMLGCLQRMERERTF